MQTIPSLDFCSAIKLCFQNYAKCSGRSRSSEFWYFYLFIFILVFVFYALILVMANTAFYEYNEYNNTYYYSSGYSFLIIVFYIFLLFCDIPMISVAVRRLHDTGRSGFYYFLSFIPFGVFILLYFCSLDSEERPNEYGPSPKYILPLNQPINPISPYPQPGYDAVPVSPYPQPIPVAQPVTAYPQPNPMAPPQSPYPQQYPGNPYPQ